jgi:ribosomal-protein-alanine N-acetyltransferase
MKFRGDTFLSKRLNIIKKIDKYMLETDRLILKPLTYSQLLKYVACDNSLEVELKLNENPRNISPELKEALEQTILPNVSDTSKNYLYSTLWTGISKEHKQMIGDICLLGEPNEAGEIEIGYGTYPAFQGRGFMTEMVSGIISWARTQPHVSGILASTDKMNIASMRVLTKNNFVCTKETETEAYWQLKWKY